MTADLSAKVLDPEQFVAVARFVDPVEAHMAKGVLESADLECFLQGENANNLLVWRFGQGCWCIVRTRRRRVSC